MIVTEDRVDIAGTKLSLMTAAGILRLDAQGLRQFLPWHGFWRPRSRGA
jgi:hypothetical protein